MDAYKQAKELQSAIVSEQNSTDNNEAYAEALRNAEEAIKRLVRFW